MKFLVLCFIMIFFIYAPNNSIAQYDYLKMVEQWPPVTCLNLPCVRNPKNFSLHGLWPSHLSGRSPMNCPPLGGFQITSVQTLFPRINNSWPEIKKGEEERFWREEWDKHGTCSQSKFPVFDYFKLALDIKDRVNILQALIDHNVQPSSTITYDYALVSKALELKTGKAPELRCIQPNGQGPVYLHEVGICLDRDGINFQDCLQTQRQKDRVVKLCDNNKFYLKPL
ncbi:ribonuclease MC-like [Vicia villosa]|uniref:ribonuclease MC-like n=1 Tax=Vicia villosa TaxID=3911 RepID=UPI00273B8FA2|nr:ribonuclease MC-like [Vicia villosa]